MFLSPVFASACWLGLCLAAAIAGLLTGVRLEIVGGAFVVGGLPAVIHLATGSRQARESSEIWVVFAWIALGLVAVLVSGAAASPLAIVLVLGPLHALSIGRYRLGTEASIFSAIGYLAIAGISAMGIPLPGKNLLGNLTGLGVLISVLQVGIFVAVTRSMLAERRGVNKQLDLWMSTLSDTPLLVLNADRRRRIRSWLGDISLLEGVSARTLSNGWLEDVFGNVDAFIKPGNKDERPQLKRKGDNACHIDFLKVRDGYRFVITPKRAVQSESPALPGAISVAGPVETGQTVVATQEPEKAAAISARTPMGVEEDQSVWIASLGHELRNMLNPVGGYSDLILAERAGPIDEVYKGFARSIKQGAEHLGLLVDDLMTASKSRSGHLTIDPEILDMVLEAQDAASLLRWQCDASSVGIVVDANADEIVIQADRKALRQILINLLSNAIKYSAPGSIVRVDLVAHEDEGQLIVTDTGEGMSEAEVARLGEPFFQGQNARGRAGTGLGLSIVLMLAEAMKGRVVFESELGEGTKVSVFLPLFKEDAQTSETEDNPQSVPVKAVAVSDVTEKAASDVATLETEVSAEALLSADPDEVEIVDVTAVEPEEAEQLIADSLTQTDKVLDGVKQRLTRAKIASPKDRIEQARKPAGKARRPLS